MRHEELRSPRQQAVRTKDYLLIIRFGRFARKVIWNERSAFCLDHPEGWTIFKENGLICIADNTNPDPKRRREKMITIPQDEKNKVTVEVPPVFNGRRHTPMSLTLKPLSPIDPPYKQILYTSTTPMAPRQLLMYQGVRYFLLKYRPVGSRLTTRVGNDAIFTYSKTFDGYSVTAFSHDLHVKHRGKKQHLPVGVPYNMSEAEFFSASFVRGIYWWRFRSVISPHALPPLEEDESEDTAREIARFKNATAFVSVLLFMLLAFSFTYNHFFPPQPVPVITKIELKAPKVIPHKVAEVKPTPTPTPPPEPPKPPEPVKEVAKKEPPKPKEPPKKVVKKEAPKPKEQPKVVKKEAPKKEPPKKVAKVPPVKKPAPVKAPPPQVAKALPVKQETPPVQTMPVKKTENPPATGAVAKKTEAPPAPSEAEQLAKSLSFLSSGSKNPKKGNLAKYDKAAKKDAFMSTPSLGGGEKDLGVLSDISAKSGDADIKTKSSRMISADAGFASPKGKGLNDVQGKVSLTELYTAGKGGGSAFSEGTGIAISGPGDLSEAEIEKALAKYLAKFQFCYEKALLKDSSLAGNIRLQWDISTKGSVSGSKVLNSQLKDATLHNCIQGVLKGISFPAPKGGSVTAKKTFSFRSSTL